MLDAQTGERRSAYPGAPERAEAYAGTPVPDDGTVSFGGTLAGLSYSDGGGASRFLYVAKASSAERNAGLEGFEAKWAPTMNGGIGGLPHDEDVATPKRNVHPTVKPIALMRWLVRLVTPPGGLVLDPFAGSGTTGIAAALEGFEFVGVEREAEYAAIARARIAWWEQHPEGMELVAALSADRERRKVADSGQMDIFGALNGDAPLEPDEG